MNARYIILALIPWFELRMSSGNPEDALKYWVDHGVVSGSGDALKREHGLWYWNMIFNYKATILYNFYLSHTIGCQPYKITSTNNPEEETPRCEKTCSNPSYIVPYEKDKHYGKEVYSIRNNEAMIRQEIYENGPVIATFRVYEDFFDYENGKNVVF